MFCKFFFLFYFTLCLWGCSLFTCSLYVFLRIHTPLRMRPADPFFPLTLLHSGVLKTCIQMFSKWHIALTTHNLPANNNSMEGKSMGLFLSINIFHRFFYHIRKWSQSLSKCYTLPSKNDSNIVTDNIKLLITDLLFKLKKKKENIQFFSNMN